jgi:ElaB/YqjD/DUF883 family membrane-anchored ribosome-binding protein
MERDKKQGGQGQHGQEHGSSLMDQAKDTAREAGDKAKQAASSVGDRAESAVTGAGKGMENLAQTIRDRGPQEGMLGSATSAVAGTLESGGRYLEEQGLSGIAEDVTNLIRRNPIPAVLVGVGLGFMLARFLNPRNY